MKRRANNEGSIYQRQSDKRWVVHYPMPGRDKPIVKYCKTEREAVKTLRELVRSDAYINPNTTTLSEWMEKWLLDYVEGTISDNFYLRKKDLVRLHVDPYIGKNRLQKLMTDDIRAYYKRLLRTGKKIKISSLSLYQSAAVNIKYMLIRAAGKRFLSRLIILTLTERVLFSGTTMIHWQLNGC